MAWQTVRSVLQFSEATGSERLLLMVIAEHCDSVNYECFCGDQLLCEESKMKDRNLAYTLKKLVTLGELEVIRGRGRGIVTRYKVILPHVSDKSEISQITAPEKVQDLVEKVQPIASFSANKGAEDCAFTSEDDAGKRCNPSSEKVQNPAEKVQSIVGKGAKSGNACKEEPYLTVEETIGEPAAERTHAREDAALPETAAVDSAAAFPFEPEVGPIDPALAVIQAMTDAVLDRYRTGGGATIPQFEARVAEQVGQLRAMGATPESLESFFRQRRRLSALRYLAENWQEWAANLNHLANGAANGSGAHLGRNGKPMLINPDSLTTKTRRNAYAIQEWIEEGSND